MASLLEGVSQFFGFNIKRQRDGLNQQLPAFAPKPSDDGASVIAATGGFYGTYVDLDGSVRTEAELVTKYRDMSLHPEVDSAIEDISSEVIISEDGEKTVKIVLDDIPGINRNTAKAIEEEFETVLNLLEFNTKSYDVFKRWYIDGRLYYHVMVDPLNSVAGIQELRFLDPRQIRKIREVTKQRDKTNPQVQIQKIVNEYYLYTDKNMALGGNKSVISQAATTGIKIAKDSIVHCTSGITDSEGKMVLGFLHKAIKPLNCLRALEDATIIYRISRAPERRVFYVDVGNLPKIKAEQYIRDMMVKHKNKLVYNAADGSIRDDRKFMCFALDTKIPLLDGRTLELTELINEHATGKKNWVYSCDPITGEFVPGPVSWAGITKTNSQVVKVTFDNGKSVICTPDHKFPVWNKGFVEAQYLLGESIIPGYRRKQIMYNTNSEYEQIYKNNTKTWAYTHREVAQWKELVGIREEMTHKIEYVNAVKKTIHHKDYNRYNNFPNNLVMMNRHDHMNYHWDMAKYGAGRRINKSEDFTPEWKINISNAKKGKISWIKTWKITDPDNEIIIIENLNEFCRNQGLNRTNIKGKFGSKKYFAEQLRNHKAVSIEWLKDKIDVGCITVDLDETYHSNHTYLLDAGVYTKNTMIEDYWMPRREGGKGTEITTLPAGQNLGVMQDVEYFQKKLYKSLNVPIGRLEPEAMFSLGRGSEITREEIKFAKFVDRLRLKFSGLFLKILERQLILKGLCSPEEWDLFQSEIKFKYLQDNRYAELKEQEILLGRMNVLQVMSMFVGRYYSNTWIRKNLLKQADEEIEEIDSEIAKELTMQQYAPSIDSMNPQLDGDQSQGPSQNQRLQEAEIINKIMPLKIARGAKNEE